VVGVCGVVVCGVVVVAVDWESALAVPALDGCCVVDARLFALGGAVSSGFFAGSLVFGTSEPQAPRPRATDDRSTSVRARGRIGGGR
jgi:hypothetical protein